MVTIAVLCVEEEDWQILVAIPFRRYVILKCKVQIIRRLNYLNFQVSISEENYSLYIPFSDSVLGFNLCCIYFSLTY